MGNNVYSLRFVSALGSRLSLVYKNWCSGTSKSEGLNLWMLIFFSIYETTARRIVFLKVKYTGDPGSCGKRRAVPSASVWIGWDAGNIGSEE